MAVRIHTNKQGKNITNRLQCVRRFDFLRKQLFSMNCQYHRSESVTHCAAIHSWVYALLYRKLSMRVARENLHVHFWSQPPIFILEWENGRIQIEKMFASLLIYVTDCAVIHLLVKRAPGYLQADFASMKCSRHIFLFSYMITM